MIGWYDHDRENARVAMQALEKKAAAGDEAAARRLRAAQAEVPSQNWLRVRVVGGKISRNDLRPAGVYAWETRAENLDRRATARLAAIEREAGFGSVDSCLALARGGREKKILRDKR